LGIDFPNSQEIQVKKNTHTYCYGVLFLTQDFASEFGKDAPRIL
jgi:hypothetical protein